MDGAGSRQRSRRAFERWIHEWLYAQRRAGGRDKLSRRAQPADAEAGYMGFPNLPHNFQLVERVQERTGIGLTADDRGPTLPCRTINWSRHLLVPVGYSCTARVRRARPTWAVARGWRPSWRKRRSQVHGYAFPGNACAGHSINNATFHLLDEKRRLPVNARIDLVLTLDCLHDMASHAAARKQLTALGSRGHRRTIWVYESR